MINTQLSFKVPNVQVSEPTGDAIRTKHVIKKSNTYLENQNTYLANLL